MLFRSCFATFGRKKGREVLRVLQEDHFEHEVNREKGRTVLQHRQEIRRLQHPLPAHTVPVLHETQTTIESPVRQALDAIFASIIESDTALESQTFLSTPCFLVHFSANPDPQNPFLSTPRHLPRHADSLDQFDSLSFASSWLQTSLASIRDSHATGSRALQTPFCVLETNYQSACKRAAALQTRYPAEKVALVTLDIVALKAARVVVSAEHAYSMLRVESRGMTGQRRLLAWVKDGDEMGNGRVLRDAVLAVVEWEGGEAMEMEFARGGNEKEMVPEGHELVRAKKMDSLMIDGITWEGSSLR